MKQFCYLQAQKHNPRLINTKDQYLSPGASFEGGGGAIAPPPKAQAKK